MNDQTFETLYELGKLVYQGELSVDEAAQEANRNRPEVAVSSARHYINWYSKMHTGEYLTWNTNSQLLLYYCRRIIEEEGKDAGALAIKSAKQFGQHAARNDLLVDLSKLAEEYDIDWPADSPDGRARFREWLISNNNYKESTVNRYIVALEKAEDRLGIKLTIPVFDVSNIEEYLIIEKEIKGSANYEEVNKNFGNGDLSAALSAYKKYITEEDNEPLPESNEGDKRAWLLTWNPANYRWDNYKQQQQMLQLGEEVTEAWACQNTHVKPGDRVYMMIIGAKEKNGIVASGFATSESYTSEHWDPAKAAEGKTIKRIDVAFDIMADTDGDNVLKQSELYEAFPEQQWSPQGSGIMIREEYTEELEEMWLKKTGRSDYGANLTIEEAVQKAKEYITYKGFTYPDGLIENFYLSLKSKPFVILAGTSGTGKTKLVKLFADAIGAKFSLVPVRPDWSDGSDLFGHTDLNGNFIQGPVCEAFDAAIASPDKPVMLCLDEMNLARVEYYLSDFLSVIESRERKDGRIITGHIAQYKDGIPDNLYVVGTVNMDETTFPFSKKVLDRANTIEFDYVDLMPEDTSDEEKVESLVLDNEFLKTKYLLLTQCEDKDYVKGICEELEKINRILKAANAHIGYRIRDEIVFYMLNNKEAGLLIDDEAFDFEIMQKILPRIQGSSSSIKEMLIELFKYCCNDNSGIDSDSTDLGNNMCIKAESARYKLSAAKIGYMMKRFEEDGFTSYWL